MNQNINNRLAFNIFVIISFCLTFNIIVFFAIFLFESISGNKTFIHQSVIFVITSFMLYLFFVLFNLLIQPAYFEARINFGQIYIKSFNPNKKNGFRFFLMLFYQRYSIEHIIARQSYNNYRIEIERFGFKKNLILQKTENGLLYESKPINISFLGAKKYTDLLLSIDRLKEKISLN